MSWLCSRALADRVSRDGSPDGQRFVRSKLRSTLAPFSRRDRKTVHLSLSLSSATFTISTGDPGVDAWISLLRAGRAKRTRARREDGKATLTYSGRPSVSSLKLPRRSSFSKTWSMLVLRWNALHSSLKRGGMRSLVRLYSQPPTWVPPHPRRRLWLLAYANRDGESTLPLDDEVAELTSPVCFRS